MPLAEAVRRGRGEERALDVAPGCLVRLGEDDQALAVLVTAVLFLWDCWVLSPDGNLAAFFSHDEWGAICGLHGVPDSLQRFWMRWVCASIQKLGKLGSNTRCRSTICYVIPY